MLSAPLVTMLRRKLSRRELVAEGAARRATHDGLSALKADFADYLKAKKLLDQGEIDAGLALLAGMSAATLAFGWSSAVVPRQTS